MPDMRALRQRQRKEELRENRDSISSEGKALREIGSKLAQDKQRLDELREAIKESGLPFEDMEAQLAELDEQERALRKQWEEDVDLPEERLEAEMTELSEESAVLSEAAAQAESKLSGFRAESNMDTSAVQNAARVQRENVEYFTDEQKEMQKFKDEQIEELKKILSNMDT